MLTSKIRLFALLSSTLICSAAPVHAQVITTIDAAGLQALMAHSASHAVYVERTAIQRPDPNVMANSEGGLLGEPVSPAVANALGCLIAGSIGTGIAAMAGTKNVVNIIAGGHVVPASQLALYTAVVGVIFGTFCAVGQTLTPLYLHVARSSPPPAPPPRPLDHKVRFVVDERMMPGRVDGVSLGLPNPEEDMSVPASWLHRKR